MDGQVDEQLRPEAAQRQLDHLYSVIKDNETKIANTKNSVGLYDSAQSCSQCPTCLFYRIRGKTDCPAEFAKNVVKKRRRYNNSGSSGDTSCHRTTASLASHCLLF